MPITFGWCEAPGVVNLWRQGRKAEAGIKSGKRKLQITTMVGDSLQWNVRRLNQGLAFRRIIVTIIRTRFRENP
jgi:hypothetical protein